MGDGVEIGDNEVEARIKGFMVLAQALHHMLVPLGNDAHAEKNGHQNQRQQNNDQN